MNALSRNLLKDEYLFYGFVLVDSVLVGFLLLSLLNFSFLVWGQITPEIHPIEDLRSTLEYQNTTHTYQTSFQPIDNLNIVSRLRPEQSAQTGSDLEKLTAESIKKIEATSLPVKLIGTMEGPRNYRLATLRNLKNREVRSLTPGETWNNLTVKQINDGSVILKNQRNGKTEILRLERTYLAKGSEKNSSRGVQKVSRYEINQSIQSNMSNILSSVNPQPVFENGQIQGVKINQMQGKPGKLLRELGFKPGDVINNINGKKINGLDKAMNLWAELQNKQNVKVDITRNGKSRTLEYSLTR